MKGLIDIIALVFFSIVVGVLMIVFTAMFFWVVAIGFGVLFVFGAIAYATNMKFTVTAMDPGEPRRVVGYIQRGKFYRTGK